MNLTNKLDLPDAIVKAMRNDTYSAGDSDYTATSLIKPARIKRLEDLHRHEAKEDVADGLWRLYGSIAHGLLERANEIDLVEKRFFHEIMGKKISAQIDTLSLHDGVLSDYKFTTAWGFIKGKETKPEWIQQMNIQNYLMMMNRHEVKKMQIIGLLRDWNTGNAKRDVMYPQLPIAVRVIPMWSRKEQLEFIETRIKEHEAAKEQLPHCSEDDRWAKPKTFAVKKKGLKRALPYGVHSSMEDAMEFAEKQDFECEIEERLGENVRCDNYCMVSEFCEQYKELKAQNKKEM